MALMRYVQPDKNGKESQPLRHKDDHHPDLPLNSPPQMTTELPEMSSSMPLAEALTSGQWQRSSDLTPEEWQQQMDQQMKQQQQHQHPQPETQVPRNTRLPLRPMDPIFKESKTMILKNVKPTTKVETILKALDPYAYLEDKNVRLVKGKPVGSKCFCFVDMETHEEVARLVEVLIKPPPLIIDGARVYAEIAKPLKNQTFKRDGEKTRPSLLGLPLELIEQNFYNQQPMGASALIQATDHGMAADQLAPGMAYMDPSVDNSYLTSDPQASVAGMGTSGEGGDAYSYDTDNQDMSNYLYDATSGFYYDPQTTLYYDPTSRYFYNSQTQQYLYWDSVTKAYIPVQGYTSDTQPPVADMSVSAASAPALPTVLESAVTLAAPPVPSTAAPAATDQPGAPETAQEGKKIADGTAERKEEEEGAARPEKKEKDEKPKSLAAFKIMKDMERWAKIQNRQKDTVRAPSPVLKAGGMDDRKASKSADAAFAIFERKGTAGDEFFKKPLTPMKKDEKSLKKPMGSLGLLVADYGAGSDEEEEEKHDPPRVVQPSQPEEKEKDDKLTDWKKMACLLCRRQFPNKDALVRHQQLSDLHKQNMEIHLKIKRSKKELEALEHQEKQLNTRERVSNSSPEAKRKKFQNSWPGGSREMHNKVGERPGLGAEPVERKKKEHVVWDHATYKQAVRKAMFARYKELE